MASSKQTKMTDYLPKPKTPVHNSIIENYFLTSPGFRTARLTKKVPVDWPWGYVRELAGHGPIGSPKDEVPHIQETLTKLLKEKYDSKKVDNAVAKGLELANPGRPGFMGTPSERLAYYDALVYAEKLLVNPGWEGALINESPPIPVTLEDKHIAGTYTEEDTNKLKTLSSEDLVFRQGLEGLFGGLKRHRKSKKSKRGVKKRRTTRKH
jgi:hypothetical protein